MVKFVCPFGVLIAACKDYPDTYLQYTANVFANVID
jgi:hypothetical protein